MVGPMVRWNAGRVAVDAGRTIVTVFALATLSGCATAGLTLFGAGTGVAMGTGAEYTLNGIAYKTFTEPVKNVRIATIDGLHRMAIRIVKDERTDSGWSIQAAAKDRTIEIELEGLTSQTTRMRVVANDGLIFKDRATESEIIAQTADALDDQGRVRKVAHVIHE